MLHPNLRWYAVSFFAIFWSFRACLYALGSVRMRSNCSDASRCIWTLSDNFATLVRNYTFLQFLRGFWGAMQKRTPPAGSLPFFAADSFGAQYDHWSSSCDRLPPWDGLRTCYRPAPRRTIAHIWGESQWCGGHPLNNIKWSRNKTNTKYGL